LEHDYNVSQKVLGTGCNGKVFLATSKHGGQGKFAVKSLWFRGFWCVDKVKRQKVVKEVVICLRLNHPHVAHIVDCYEADDHLDMVMECMTGEDLDKNLTKRKTFAEADAQSVCHQILQALKYIHGKGLVHRDIKLANFMYQSENSDYVKMIDFGLGKFWKRGDKKMEEDCGTLNYAAPELLEKNYTSQCDLWSLGVLAFVLLVGCFPFEVLSDEGKRDKGKTISLIKAGNPIKMELRFQKSKVSNAGYEFVSQLLVLDDSHRLTADAALKHRWIAQGGKTSQAGSLDQLILTSLCNFASESRLRRSCLLLAAWSLSVEDTSDSRQAFSKMDTDGSGTISFEEFYQCFQEKFATKQDALNVFADLQHDESLPSDEINYSEFLAATMSSTLHNDLISATFRRFDRNGDGHLSKAELQRSLGNELGSEAIETMDKDGDMQVSLVEFSAYLRSGKARSTHRDAALELIDSEQ
jgi:calcium-dependent protein kinase